MHWDDAPRIVLGLALEERDSPPLQVDLRGIKRAEVVEPRAEEEAETEEVRDDGAARLSIEQRDKLIISERTLRLAIGPLRERLLAPRITLASPRFTSQHQEREIGDDPIACAARLTERQEMRRNELAGLLAVDLIDARRPALPSSPGRGAPRTCAGSRSGRRWCPRSRSTTSRRLHREGRRPHMRCARRVARCRLGLDEAVDGDADHLIHALPVLVIGRVPHRGGCVPLRAGKSAYGTCRTRAVP